MTIKKMVASLGTKAVFTVVTGVFSAIGAYVGGQVVKGITAPKKAEKPKGKNVDYVDEQEVNYTEFTEPTEEVVEETE